MRGKCGCLIRTPEQMYEYTKSIKDAKKFILQTSTMDRFGRLKPMLSGMKKSPAIVLDIDETVFQTHCWNCGTQLENVIPINPMKSFYRWCVDKNLAVFFVTARTEGAREYTFNELKKNGFDKYAHLFMMPDDANRITFTVQTFKANCRKTISDKFTILANFGDQPHDIRGEPSRSKQRSVPKEGNCFSMKGYLLPDPMIRDTTFVGVMTPMGVGFLPLGRPKKKKIIEPVSEKII